MPSSYPQPANRTYNTTEEVMAHLAIHDTLGCAERCQHIKLLQSQYGIFTVALALDKFAQGKDKK